MAATYKLVCQFGTADGGTVTHSYFTTKTASSEGIVSQINAYMDACIANKEQFAKPPVSKKGAYIVATDQNKISL